MPRFILSVRELYDRDLRGHFQGVDTGFGVSQSIGSQDGAISAIAFADVGVGHDRVLEDDAGELEVIQPQLVIDGGAR